MYELTVSDHIVLAIFALIAIIWSVSWKVYAAWTAVKRNDKKWFVAIIILNTVGILEIIYVFKIAKKKWIEVKKDFNHALESVK